MAEELDMELFVADSIQIYSEYLNKEALEGVEDFKIRVGRQITRTKNM
jgi:hypothetical protein